MSEIKNACDDWRWLICIDKLIRNDCFEIILIVYWNGIWSEQSW